MTLHSKQGLGCSYSFAFPAFIRRILPALFFFFFKLGNGGWQETSFPRFPEVTDN